MTLALLITAVTGAWADEPKVYDSGEVELFSLQVGDILMPGVTLKNSDGNNIAGANLISNRYSKDGVISQYSNSISSIPFSIGENGLLTAKLAGDGPYNCMPITEDGKAGNAWVVTYIAAPEPNYKTILIGGTTDPNTIELKPDETGKNWILADMPASNIELQVEYEPTKVTMAANDNAMGTVEVSGESKVEWTADTWNGWTANTKEYTVDDITMASTQSAYINEYTNEDKYLHSLFFYVNQTDDNSTVTFSTTGDPFSRIEFTMIDDYDDDEWVSNKGVWVGNPVIMPKDNWTFEGKSAVWEGEATKSLTLQSCTTWVSKITFFKGAVPDGVTVNGDGTFTVAKTATVTLTATPKEGYKFLYWEDDQTNTNPVREVTIESGMADKTYKAVFAEILYNVTFADGIEEADKWSATPNTNVKKETKVDIKYSGAKKVIGVKAAKKSESLIVNPVVGQVIGSDGKNYDANATLPDGVKAVAVIAYVGSETGDDTYKNGLAIALADEADSNWSTAKSTCEGKTAITGAKWCLPSQDQWKQMFKANGGNNARYTGLNTTITTAGGTALKTENGDYWSSSEEDPGVLAYRVNLDDGDADWYSGSEGSNRQVRACLAF